MKYFMKYFILVVNTLQQSCKKLVPARKWAEQRTCQSSFPAILYGAEKSRAVSLFRDWLQHFIL